MILSLAFSPQRLFDPVIDIFPFDWKIVTQPSAIALNLELKKQGSKKEKTPQFYFGKIQRYTKIEGRIK